MEKEKPYKCDVCGKRYKNLNGLKYVSILSLNYPTILLTTTAQTTLAALQPRDETQRPPPSRRPQQHQRRPQRQRPRPPRHRRRRHALTSLQGDRNIKNISSKLRPEKIHNLLLSRRRRFFTSFFLSWAIHSSCICAALTKRDHTIPPGRIAAPRERAGDATIQVDALTLRPPDGLSPFITHHTHTRSARVSHRKTSLLPRPGFIISASSRFKRERQNQKCSAFYAVY